MPVFQLLQPASFDGIKFAVRAVGMKGGLRHHVHEFPHSPGGKIEDLARRNYTITMAAMFNTEMFREYPDAWPGDISDLFDRFEQGVRAPLVVPAVGELQAICIDWDRQWQVANQSGEVSEFTFLEDADEALLVSNVVQVAYQAIGAKAAALQIEADAMGFGDAFSSIQGFCSSVMALGDRAELLGDLYASKVKGVADSCRAVISRGGEIANPRSHRVLRAVIDLGVTAEKLHATIVSTLPTFLYTVPNDTDIFGVARAIYGDHSRAMELLRMNPVNDIDAIVAGTTLRALVKAA